eukprot:8257862-Heterocapsa_arctica.AAC.1
MCGRHEAGHKDTHRELQAADDGNGGHRSSHRNGQGVPADQGRSGFPHEEGEAVQEYTHLPHMQSIRRHERQPEVLNISGEDDWNDR